jgi:hypothetical protein
MTLIASEFSETAVTWTRRDVQNLFPAHTSHLHEAFELMSYFNSKNKVISGTLRFNETQTL